MEGTALNIVFRTEHSDHSMPEDGVIQLRRNPSKQKLARAHMTRYGKGTKATAPRTSKLSGTTARKPHGLHASHSGASLNQSASNTNLAEGGDGGAHQSPRGNASATRLQRAGRSNPSMAVGGNTFGLHRYRGLSSGLGNSGQLHRKPVIQLDREDEDDEDDDENDRDKVNRDYEDYEDETESSATLRRPPPPDRSDSQLSIGIQPVEPTPPKLSEETVITVSSLADMASALKGAQDKSSFVGSDDLISTAVTRSKNLGNMARMVHGWNSGKQRGMQAKSWKAAGGDGSRAAGNNAPGEGDPREYEKVFREYTNTRAICNPVISSLYRVSVAHGLSTKANMGRSSLHASASGSAGSHSTSTIPLPSVKVVNSLVATTADQMSDYSDRNLNSIFTDSFSGAPSPGAIESASTCTLNKIWQTGWTDPQATTSKSSLPAQLPLGIQSRAMRVNQQLIGQKDD